MRAKPIQFLDAKRKDDAERIWHAELRLAPLPAEAVAIDAVLGRVLAEDVRAPIDVPPFDRAIVDGYAVVAADTFGASDAEPARLRLLPSPILAGTEPSVEVEPGQAVEIATGGVLPRGANGAQMVERTDVDGDSVLVYRPVVPGSYVQAAGSDLRAGDMVLPRGTVLSSRETGVLASLGVTEVPCVRRPRVAVLSTGDELVAPGGELPPGSIYDANSRVVADALAENGAVPDFRGIIPDREEALAEALEATREHDAVILSGGTSKGTGDLSFRLIDELGVPGILVHGVQVKPGKPIVLASWAGRPVVVLPGFPTSAILTFNLFVRPVIRRLAGLVAVAPQATVTARVPQRVHSAPGRYEYLLVNLVRSKDDLVAYPVAKSSGSISAFADADGYLEVPESRDMLLAGESARVTLLGHGVRPADLVFVGSHCQGMDLLFARLRNEHGLVTKVLSVGSQGGVAAVSRGEADVAGVHLLASDGRYNEAARREAGEEVALVRGYRRRQGILFRTPEHEQAPSLGELVDSDRRLINRPRGAGTRVLLDLMLAELAAERGVSLDELQRGLRGYDTETRSHNAAAAAIANGRADWGLGIEAAARAYGLGFSALRDEDYDLLIPRAKLATPAVEALLEVLRSDVFRRELEALGGFAGGADTGQVVAGA